MQGKLIFVFIAAVVLAGIDTAAAAHVQLSLKDISTNLEITGVVAEAECDGVRTNIYVDTGSPLVLELAEGRHPITIMADLPSTPGKDYFSSGEITVSGDGEVAVYLYPAGSVRGIVKDAFENVVGEAELRLECANEIGSPFPLKASKFGSFEADYMPTGSCKILANYGNAVGFKDVEIRKGQIAEAEILLDKTIITLTRASTYEAAALILLLAAIGLISFSYFRKRKAGSRQKKEENPAHEAAGKRARDLMKTLSGKEKKIAEFLMQQKGEVHQSAVRHNTGIPRTSLSRCLKSLEAKNIIQIKAVGKLVKIRLTDWFTEKE